ncbi:MAG: acyltransferase [Bacteroidetes bacterium]|nr:acyltransferase [Bacteroidota bacterium]
MIKNEFKHFDALRGIMAMYVTFVHFFILYTLNKHKALVFTNQKYLGIVQLGQVFMTVFFVLSGFLITYILLREKQKHGTINFKRFYLRRAFRILPMYYLTVILMYWLYHKACGNIDIIHTPMCMELNERAIYYFAFLPNVAYAIEKTLPHISNFWSIGAEEQFYIFWPLVLYFFRQHLKAFWYIYLFYCLLLMVMVLIGNLYYHNANQEFINVAKFFDYTRFGAFAFGGIIAHFILFDKEEKQQRLHQFFKKKSTQVFCLFFCFFINIFPDNNIMFLKHILVIPCCGILIYNFAVDDSSLLKIDNKYWNYIGKTTYSLYILNQIVIDFVIKICFFFHIVNPFAVAIISIGLLIVASIICYEFIEKPFMQLRRKFG